MSGSAPGAPWPGPTTAVAGADADADAVGVAAGGWVDVSSLGSILSVWAHPDDETYLSGGTMAAAAAAGQRVTCVSATAGEHGTDDPDRWPPERLGRVRRAEAAAAMAVLGVDDHRFLGFGDGGLDDVGDRVGVAAMGEVIDEVEPDTILTFGPDGITGHPDHVAVCRWVTAAWDRRWAGGNRSVDGVVAADAPRLLWASNTVAHLRRFGPLYDAWGVYMTDARPVGVSGSGVAAGGDLCGPALDAKLAALAAMPTQTGDVVSALDAETWQAINTEEVFVVGRSAGVDPSGVVARW